MTTLGLVGSGNIGSTVARPAVDAGYDVVLSNSRGPETLSDLVDRLGPRARAGEAAAAGDLVLVTVPLHACTQVPAEPRAGKTVVDTNDDYPDRDGHVDALERAQTTTSSMLQEHLPESKVVKVPTNIFVVALARLGRLQGADDRSGLPVLGDDAGAKAEVAAFLDAVGYDALDADHAVRRRGRPHDPLARGRGRRPRPARPRRPQQRAAARAADAPGLSP